MYLSDTRQKQIVRGNVDGRQTETLHRFDTDMVNAEPIGELTTFDGKESHASVQVHPPPPTPPHLPGPPHPLPTPTSPPPHPHPTPIILSGASRSHSLLP